MHRGNQQKQLLSRPQKHKGIDGVDFVLCRICGEHRRAITGRHLSKHSTDRETYLEECALSPDGAACLDNASGNLHRSTGMHCFGLPELARL
jgi:hypothetical protein